MLAVGRCSCVRILILHGSFQNSNVSYSTEHSFAQSKAGSVDTSKPSESMEHARSGSSVLGSALDVVRQFQEYLDVRLSHTF